MAAGTRRANGVARSMPTRSRAMLARPPHGSTRRTRSIPHAASARRAIAWAAPSPSGALQRSSACARRPASMVAGWCAMARRARIACCVGMRITLIAIAQDDDAKDPAAKSAFGAAANEAGAAAEVEVYAADHGWCVPDSPRLRPRRGRTRLVTTAGDLRTGALTRFRLPRSARALPCGQLEEGPDAW